MLPIAVAAILVVAVGAVSLNWNTGFGIFARHNQTNKTIVNRSTVFGWNYQNMSYNSSRTNTYTVNRTAELEELSTTVQCRTNFIDSSAPIASSALNVTLNTPQVNAANAALQSDITSNASSTTIRSDILVFDGSALRLFGEALHAAQKLNQTQIQSLRTQLNSSVQTLQNCTSTTTGTTLGMGGFGSFGGFGSWNFFRGFRMGFHFGARTR